VPPRISVVHGEKSPYETESEYRKRRKQEMANDTAAKRPVRVVKGSNFEPKRVRKAKRKALIRGVIGGGLVSLRSEYEDRAEFYRNLRMVKLRRKLLAREMTTLSEMVAGLLGEVQRIDTRNPEAAGPALDEARELVKAAHGSVSTAADEFRMFARNRIYYVKEF
jgi:hypothetical protein